MAQHVGLFGRIALKKGYVGEAALFQALRTQEELRAFGLKKPLGQLLVDAGALAPGQVDEVLRLQRLNEAHREAKRFGRVALRNGLIDGDQFQAALDEARAEGHKRSLGAVLIERGDLTPEVVATIAVSRATAEEPPKIKLSRPSPAPAAPPELSPPASAAEAADDDDDVPTQRLDPGTLADSLAVVPPPGPVSADDGTVRFEPGDLVGEAEAQGWQQDLLFSAVALREGHVSLAELERALGEQRLYPDPPRLHAILVERGVLSPRQVDEIMRRVDDDRSEKLRVPGYEIGELIGQGATSLVFRARHELIGRDVAIKVLRRESEDGLQQLLEEARATASVRHPNVVGLHEVGRLQRRVFFVMELVDGPSLMEVIQREGRIAPKRALRWGRDVALALSALEGAGLVHRDVKPHNILIAPDGTARLTDLGLARRTGWRAPEGGAIDGTPHTISPEQAQGRPVDIRGDLYSLGATLFYAVTGRPPFDDVDPLAIVLRHIEDPVPDPQVLRPDLTPQETKLITGLLAKDPEDRPQTPAVVAAAIEHVLG